MTVEEIQTLQAENTTLKRQLSEALRALRKTTGCNWATTIAARALPTVKREVCPTCHGMGETPIDRWSRMSDVEPTRCEPCAGQGEIYVDVPADEKTT